MNTESPIRNPPPIQERDLPPSYQEACFLQSHQLSRIILRPGPDQGGEIQTAFNDSNENEPPPPAYETVCIQEPHQILLDSPTVDSVHGNDCHISFTNILTTEQVQVPPTTLEIIPIQTSRVKCVQQQVFVKNVYGIVTAQLMVVTVCITEILNLFNEARDDKLLVTMAAIIVFNILAAAFLACTCIPKKSPVRIICLLLFALTIGIYLGAASVFIGSKTILLFVVFATILCGSLTIFAVNLTTRDAILLLLGIAVVIYLGLLCVNVFSFYILLCAGLTALIFSAFLVYDTHVMVNGKHELSEVITTEDSIYAVQIFFVDCILIWLRKSSCKVC